MEANQQSLQHLSCVVPQPAAIVSWGGQWVVAQVRWEFAHKEQSWKMSAN
jgi:hypothetical protein